MTTESPNEKINRLKSRVKLERLRLKLRSNGWIKT